MKVTKLLIMAVLHFAIMYMLMYSMVDRINYVYPNLNQFYMAGIMTAPMLIIEILLMRSMYDNQKILTLIFGASFVVLIFFFLFIRNQTGITDKEFLRSMIPHHSGAILMCRNTTLSDPEIKELCIDIISSQQREIDIMEAKLDELN